MKLVLNVGLSWPEVDHVYSVGYHGQLVGKVWFAIDKRGDATPWEWLLSLPMALPDDSRGIARSRADALHALARSLHTLITHTSPDRFERTLAFAAATGLGFASGETMEFALDDPVASHPQQDGAALRRSAEQPQRPGHASQPQAAAATPAARPVVTFKKTVTGRIGRPAFRAVPTVKLSTSQAHLRKSNATPPRSTPDLPTP